MKKRMFIILSICVFSIALIIYFGHAIENKAISTADKNEILFQSLNCKTTNALEMSLTNQLSLYKLEDWSEDDLLYQDIYIEDETEFEESDDNVEIEKEADEKDAVTTLKDFDEAVEFSNAENAAEALNIENPAIDISAEAAILINCNTGEILFHKNSLEEISPASTTKLLSAIVALDYCGEDEEFIVGDEINYIASDSSRAYLVEGQILSLSQILDALLLPSGNDAAYVIAAHVGRKIGNDSKLSVKEALNQFIDAMNEKVEELHLTNSHFKSPDGYDKEGQYTTAYDMGYIAVEALTYPLIRETVSKTKARDILISGEDVTWSSTNKLIKQGSGFFYKYAIGLKTGTSDLAGRCLISAAQKDDKTYVCVVMDASIEGRWQDSIDVLQYAIGK